MDNVRQSSITQYANFHLTHTGKTVLGQSVDVAQSMWRRSAVAQR
jgi:hypothetical protein